MIIEGIKFTVVITTKDTYKSWMYIYRSRRKVLVASIMGIFNIQYSIQYRL